ncbi:hypothetical protein ES703_17551 [subsurface metagenome]
MQPLRQKLENMRTRAGLPWEVIERDYMLSWMLAGIAANAILKDALAFKGGTALKKCYFGEYRFSEDLDFTTRQDWPKGDSLEAEIIKVCETSTEMAQEYSPLEFTAERYTEKEAHPAAQEAFTVRGRFPWHKQSLAKVMIEITVDEPILREPTNLPIIHSYNENIDQEILTYTLEEIVAEKLRAILQHKIKLEERGWAPSRARDYYDIWNILNDFQNRLDVSLVPDLLKEKCKVRDVVFTGKEQFFDGTLLKYVSSTWEQWLGSLVSELPPFDAVISDLKLQLNTLFGTD